MNHIPRSNNSLSCCLNLLQNHTFQSTLLENLHKTVKSAEKNWQQNFRNSQKTHPRKHLKISKSSNPGILTNWKSLVTLHACILLKLFHPSNAHLGRWNCRQQSFPARSLVDQKSLNQHVYYDCTQPHDIRVYARYLVFCWETWSVLILIN